MKWIIFILHCNLFNTIGQNLIPNYSFELVDSCTQSSDYLYTSGRTINFYCKGWFDDYAITYSSSDFMGNCLHTDYDIPNTIYGYSYAYHGNRFAGVGLIGLDQTSAGDVREYISVQLNDTLTKDSAYCVSFFYKNSRTYNKDYSLDNIGILFTNDTLTQLDLLNQPANLRTKKGELLTNTEWIEFSDYYVATGGESFFNLGLFGRKNDTEFYTTVEGWVGYMYFIDNVSVIPCNKDSIFNVILEIESNVITPNNDFINDTYQ